MSRSMIDRHDESESYKPIQLSLEQLEQLRSLSYVVVRDEYQSIIEELFKTANPSSKQLDQGTYAAEFAEYQEQFLGGKLIDEHGAWFYYPWQHTVVHVPESEIYYHLKSARNRNLITQSDQQKLSKLLVGVAGLSVGSSAVAALTHIGIRNFKLADADTLAVSNLNRLRGGIHQIGIAKTIIATRNIYELDPYANVELYSEGLSQTNIGNFVTSLDILVDEIDDVAMKTHMRLLAKEHRLPVLMATDNGDNVLIDIERYDEDDSLPIFHGLLTEDEVETILNNTLSHEDFMRYALKIIDARHAPVRMLESVPLVGRQLEGIPQLGTAAMMAGAVIAYAIREIATDAPLKHGKHHVNLEGLLRADYANLELQQRELLMRMMR